MVYPIVVPITGLIPSAPGAEEVEGEKVEEVEVEESGPEDEFEEAEDEESMMVQQLVQMGFTDKAVNAEVLKKKNFDLQSTLDELVTAVKWDGALNELEEMVSVGDVLYLSRFCCNTIELWHACLREYGSRMVIFRIFFLRLECLFREFGSASRVFCGKCVECLCIEHYIAEKCIFCLYYRNNTLLSLFACGCLQGFSDRSKNLSLLYKFDGNAKAVVRMLVQELGQK